MFTKTAVAAALCVLSAPVAAQVTGGSLDIEYDFPTDGGDLGGTTYSGAIEYGFTRDFSVSLDIAGYRLDNINTDATNVTVHGIYHLDDLTSFGAFIGSDATEDSDRQSLYGIEAGTEFGTAEVEAYVAAFDGENEDATLFGADGKYDFGNGFSAIASYGLATSDDIDLSRLALGAEYEIAGGPQFYAEIGTVDADGFGVTAEETFIGLGARVAFGAERGTTFGQRSLFEILPGF